MEGVKSETKASVVHCDNIFQDIRKISCKRTLFNATNFAHFAHFFEEKKFHSTMKLQSWPRYNIDELVSFGKAK